MYKWDEMTTMQKDTFIIRKMNLPYRVIDFSPTSDMNDAWDLFDRIGLRIEVKNNGPIYHCYIDTGATSAEADADTVPEAICKTVLKIIGVEIE